MTTTNNLDKPEHLWLCLNCERIFAAGEVAGESKPQQCDRCSSRNTRALLPTNEWCGRLREPPLRQRAKPEDRAGPASAS